MPMTMKYFRFPSDSDDGALLSMDSCVALADANSISRFDIVLSGVLLIVKKFKPWKKIYDSDMSKSAYTETSGPLTV
jgi:hypothetical protein